MGIKRLYQNLRADFKNRPVSDLTGQKIAIDTMGWIYQAYFSMMEHSGDTNMFILRYFERKVNALKKFDIEVL